MKKPLSRLECEYILSRVAVSKPALRVSVSAPSGRSGTFTYSAVCRPAQYSCDPQARLFFFDATFLKENRIPQDVPCWFFFFYETKRLCFSAEISVAKTAKARRLACRAARLFYAEGESFFLPSTSAKLSFSSIAGHLCMRVHKSFLLDTADMRGRAQNFLQFATNELGEAGFNNALEDYAVSGGNGILFYLDHIAALACFSLSSAAALFPSKERATACEEAATNERTSGNGIRNLPFKESQHRGVFFVDFGLRKIKAECLAFLRNFRESFAFCSISFINLEPENIRFLYEMSRKEKYLGGELP